MKIHLSYNTISESEANTKKKTHSIIKPQHPQQNKQQLTCPNTVYVVAILGVATSTKGTRLVLHELFKAVSTKDLVFLVVALVFL